MLAGGADLVVCAQRALGFEPTERELGRVRVGAFSGLWCADLTRWGWDYGFAFSSWSRDEYGVRYCAPVSLAYVIGRRKVAAFPVVLRGCAS